jgi:hypothetical protein
VFNKDRHMAKPITFKRLMLKKLTKISKKSRQILNKARNRRYRKIQKLNETRFSDIIQKN